MNTCLEILFNIYYQDGGKPQVGGPLLTDFVNCIVFGSIAAGLISTYNDIAGCR